MGITELCDYQALKCEVCDEVNNNAGTTRTIKQESNHKKSFTWYTYYQIM